MIFPLTAVVSQCRYDFLLSQAYGSCCCLAVMLLPVKTNWSSSVESDDRTSPKGSTILLCMSQALGNCRADCDDQTSPWSQRRFFTVFHDPKGDFQQAATLWRDRLVVIFLPSQANGSFWLGNNTWTSPRSYPRRMILLWMPYMKAMISKIVPPHAKIQCQLYLCALHDCSEGHVGCTVVPVVAT